MSEFKKGDFIKWTSTDDEGKFSYVGLVRSVNGASICFETYMGTLNIAPDDGKFVKVEKPADWDEQRAASEKRTAEMHKTNKRVAAKPAPAVKVKATRAPRAKKGGSKIDQIVELLQAQPELVKSRKDAIAAIVAAGISTPAGASTFFNTAKKLV